MAILSGPVLQQTAARFALLGDPTRLHLLSLLLERSDYSVGELAAAAGISVANASQHLRRLETGGILGRRRTGNTVHYRIVEASIEQLCAIVCASVAERARVLVPADTTD
jgi:DNA-binding transcriptional ArsR family regulator